MKQNNIKIAVTGGIGSGKSTVCRILKDCGQAVFSCDEVYEDLLSCKKFLNKLTDGFGESILSEDGSLDREKFSSEVFNDKNKLQKLNSITHPEIFKEMFRRAEGISGLVFFEVPLLFEGGYEGLFCDVVVVEREISERIASVVARDGISEENVKKRILNQFNYDNCYYSKYYVIHNDGNINDLHNNTVLILKEIIKKYLI